MIDSELKNRLIDIFDADQAGIMITLVDRISATEVLLEMSWANELAKGDNPTKDALAFKKQVMSLVRPKDEHDAPAIFLEELLDSIIKRVRSL